MKPRANWGLTTVSIKLVQSYQLRASFSFQPTRSHAWYECLLTGWNESIRPHQLLAGKTMYSSSFQHNTIMIYIHTVRLRFLFEARCFFLMPSQGVFFLLIINLNHLYIRILVKLLCDYVHCKKPHTNEMKIITVCFKQRRIASWSIRVMMSDLLQTF